MSTTRTITAVESAPFATSKVNREAGYIDGVLICGVTSRNGRDYPPAVLARDYAKYESAPVNADHGDESTVGRRLGWISDVKPGADGRPRGRLNVLKSHPLAESVFEAAERNPSLFGMSHVAVCGTKRVNGRETVESINKVLSIDLVADPATTKSLYESYTRAERPMKLRAYCEAIAAKWPTVAGKLKVLTEMDQMDDMGDMEMEMPPPLESSPDDPVKAAFMTAIRGLTDQLETDGITGDDFMKKVKELLKAHGKMSGMSAEPAADMPEPAEMESVRKQLAGVLKENATLKLEKLIGDTVLTPVQRKAVEALADEVDRKALVESFRHVRTAQKPVSGEQNKYTVKEGKAGGIPTDGKAFAELVVRKN
jgi:hypothetical protein